MDNLDLEMELEQEDGPELPEVDIVEGGGGRAQEGAGAGRAADGGEGEELEVDLDGAETSMLTSEDIIIEWPEHMRLHPEDISALAEEISISVSTGLYDRRADTISMDSYTVTEVLLMLSLVVGAVSLVLNLARGRRKY